MAGKKKKRGAPFKGEVRDSENERFIKEKRSIFRSFKCFYSKAVHLNPELVNNRKRMMQEEEQVGAKLLGSELFNDL